MTRRLPLLLALCLFLFPLLIYATPLKSLSKKLRKGLKAEKDFQCAVLNFTYPRGRMSTGSVLISERIITYLVRGGSTVIERRLLEKLMEEQHLGQTGIINPKTVPSMGKVLGVDAVVLGTLTDLSDSVTEVQARAINVATGEILASATTVIGRLWRDRPRMPRLAHMRAPVPMAAPGLRVTPDQRRPSRKDFSGQTSIINGRVRSAKGSGQRKPARKGGKWQSPRYRPAPVPAANFQPSSRYRLGGEE